MTAYEMIEKLYDNGVLHIHRKEKNYIYVEDCESYCGEAELFFDDNGNCIEVREVGEYKKY